MKIGIDRTANGLAEYPGLWWVFIVLLAGVLFFLSLFQLARSSLARLEIWRDRLRLTPDRVQQIMGDPVIEKKIPAQSKEVLLRHSSRLRLRFGYSIIIRGEGGAEYEVKSTCLNRLDRQNSLKLADAIRAGTGLPVQIVRQVRADDGSLRDATWT